MLFGLSFTKRVTWFSLVFDDNPVTSIKIYWELIGKLWDVDVIVGAVF